MVPPAYPDLGKLARDLFNRGYHPSLWQLECKTMSSSGIQFNTKGNAIQDNGKVFGVLQSKYKIEDYGLTLTEAWNTRNSIYAEILHVDKLTEGLTLGLAGWFHTDYKEGRCKVGYAQDNFHFLSDNEIKSKPIINASLVVGHKELLGGVGCDFDIGNTKLKSWKVALGWTNEQDTLHGELKDGNSWLASLFHKFNDKFDAGLQISKMTRGSSSRGSSTRGSRTNRGSTTAPMDEPEEIDSDGNFKIGLGIIHHLDADSLIRAKINNSVEIGLGYEQKLREGITASISAILDGGNLNGGNHKFGFGLAIEC